MIIGKAAFEQAVAHLIDRARAGEEGVGLLAGPKAAPAVVGPVQPNARRLGVLTNMVADRWESLTNVSDFPRLRYQVDPDDLMAAYVDLETVGYIPLVLVHSHLRGGFVPSPTDVRYATNPALLHMIVDLGTARPVSALWRILPGEREGEQTAKIRYQVADLREQEVKPTDLTRGVTSA